MLSHSRATRPCAPARLNRWARRPLPVFIALACPALAYASDPPSTDHLTPIVVTAPMETSPLTVVTDPKAPRQPVPASDGADFLKSIPGFSTIRKGGTNGDPVLRGMAGSRLNILVDGGQIGGGCPSRMDPPTSYISPQLYDKVTVIKGPETVLYGPGNSAGTVLFDREFVRYTEPTVGLNASVLGGSWGRNDQMVDLRGGTSQGYLGISANHTHSQDYEDGNGDRVRSYYDRWNADATVGWTPTDDTRVELTAGRGDGKAAYAFSSMDGAQFLRESAGLKVEIKNLSEHVTQLEAQVYTNYADHVMDNYTLRDPDPASMMPMAMASDVARRTHGGRAAVTMDWPDVVTVVAGVDGSTNTHTVRNGGPPGSMMGYYRDLPRDRDARMSTIGTFAEATWRLDATSRLITGGRADRAHARGYTLASDDSGMGMGDMDVGGMDMGMGMGASATTAASRSNWLPSGFVRYEHDLAAMPGTFYAGVGHVERFPDYWELFGGHVAGDVDGFRRVAPEKTTQLDIGFQYRTDRLKAWVSAYTGVVNDFILIRYGLNAMATGAARNVSARTAGGEAGAVFALTDHWKVDGTLAYAWGENRTDHRPLPQMPPLEARFGLTYDTGAWSAGALWRVVHSQHHVAVGDGNIVGQDLGPTGGFGVFSLNGGYRFSKTMTLSAGVDNLLNKTYAEHVNAATAGLVGYVNTTRVNEPGRTLWAKVEVTL
ncbi:TonB-dependent copper receptor [Luteibacter sahnii]|uniref:TonB-dependent copper receptor n=1 Tax=Luteibacter sahnii TaxID=3021977 RepID=UPI002A6AF4AD|nr:TonB-dependent copper receptor [Luteibacter sp. PPL193]MDY1547860.1 TonB-dependent copper receptor [Luteibacter sp. PPL193]